MRMEGRIKSLQAPGTTARAWRGRNRGTAEVLAESILRLSEEPMGKGHAGSLRPTDQGGPAEKHNVFLVQASEGFKI